jgi:hypothetical protein
MTKWDLFQIGKVDLIFQKINQVPIIPAIWEAEIRRIILIKKLARPPSQQTSQMWGLTCTIPAIQEA